MKKLFFLLFLFLLSFSLHGQVVAPEQGDIDAHPFQGAGLDLSQPKQAFTPNAANLGVYGKIPVNYYTGSADVQIPLAELTGKDCTQPVYLSYRTGGHKVSEVPGPFGLGWTLHAGGCINRIINGQKDEMSAEEMAYLTDLAQSERWSEFLDNTCLSTPGYLYHPKTAQSTAYNYSAFFYPHYFDLAPDEFQICADGLSGSFYIGEDGTPMLVSKSTDSYKISYETETIQEPVTLYHKYSCSIVVHYFTYISKIVITDSKGVKYTFGGDMSAIDFSYSPTNTPSLSYHHTKEDNVSLENMSLDEMEQAYWETYPALGDPKIMGIANTWHLVSKEYPTTGEIISFTYEKKGFPIHMSDVNTRFIVLTNDRTMADATAINPNGDIRIWENLSFTDDRKNTIQHTLPKTNISYTILNPSYLISIKSKKTNDSVVFTYQYLDGLRYYPESYDLGMLFHLGGEMEAYDFITEENKYYTAIRVSSSKGGTYLRYTRDNTDNLVGGEVTEASINDRPLSFLSGKQKPASLISPTNNNPGSITPFTSIIFPEENRRYRIHLAKVILCGGTSAKREYTLSYNQTRLPFFDAKVSDHWGYYNGRGYGFLLSTTYNTNVVMSDSFCEHGVDEYFNEYRIATGVGIAESLERITYPTGGSTTFVYEPHQYNKVAEVYPKRILHDSGIAGGFRIKEIIDSTGNKKEIRTYTYNKSGILNGKPKYGTVGYYVSQNSEPIVEQENYVGWASGFNMYSKFRMASEGLINQIPVSSGSHIAYSHVTEHLADGSSIDYKYTDWEKYPDIQAETYHTYKAKDLMNPFTSCDLMRGLLEEVSYKNADGIVVKIEQMTYRDSVCTPSAYGDLKTGLYSYTNKQVYPSDSPWYYSLSRVYKFFPPLPYVYDSMPYFIRLSRCYIFGKTPYLVQKKVTTWNPEGEMPITTTTQYEYNEKNQIVSEKTIGSSVIEHRTRWSGDIKFGPYKGMAEAGMIGFPIEETVIENGYVISSVIHRYGLSGGNIYRHLADYRSMSQSGIAQSSFIRYDGIDMDPSYGSAPEVSYLYNADGNVINTSQRDESSTSIIWGYNGTRPIMVCSAKDYSTIACHTFEDDLAMPSFASIWDEGFQSPRCHVGPFAITLPDVADIDTYVVDYMVNNIGEWIYKRIEINAKVGTYTIAEGERPIDNVRVYPKGEEVVSYTWFPRVGVRSSTDGAGNIQTYEYDVNGRLQAVYDVDGNPVIGYYYRYRTSPKN